MQYFVSVRFDGHLVPLCSDSTSTFLSLCLSPPPQDWEQKPQLPQSLTTQSTEEKFLFDKTLSDCSNSLKFNMSFISPGQGCSWHTWLSFSWGQSFPPFSGCIVTFLVLASVPFPQLAEHSLHVDQSPTSQSTGWTLKFFIITGGQILVFSYPGLHHG